jgi:hypothetical protein
MQGIRHSWFDKLTTNGGLNRRFFRKVSRVAQFKRLG